MYKLLNLKYKFQNHGTLTFNNANGFCFFVILPSNICSGNICTVSLVSTKYEKGRLLYGSNK